MRLWWTAADRDDLAGHEGSDARCERENGTDNVIRFGNALLRHGKGQRRHVSERASKAADHAGVGRYRCDSTDAHARRSTLERAGFGTAAEDDKSPFTNEGADRGAF